MLAHDGPLGHDARGYDWLAQVLASRGYVVLQPNYRGSDSHDLAFTEAGYGEWSGRMISDLSDGVRYLAAEGIIDPNRVCIAGRGYGGYAALASAKASAKASTYRCTISLNGISDPADYLKDAKRRAVTDAIAPIKADPSHDRNFIADPRSPSLIQRYFGAQTPAPITAADIDLPVLLVHVENNRAVPIAQSINLSNELQRAGKRVTYTQLSDCPHDHDLNTPACRLTTAQTVTDFLAQHNPAR